MILKSTFFLVLLSEMTQAANTRMSRTSPFFQGDVFHCATGNQEVCSYKDVIWNRDLKASIMPAKLVEPSVTLIEYPEAVPSRFEKRAFNRVRPYFQNMSAWCARNKQETMNFHISTWGPTNFLRNYEGRSCFSELFDSIRCGDASAIERGGNCWCGYILGSEVDSIQFRRKQIEFKSEWDGRMRMDFEAMSNSNKKVGLTIDCTNKENVERTLDKWYTGGTSTGYSGNWYKNIDLGVAD
ncbi:hypothetical protein AX774_g1892 [Zancudomyces culisetae]|uniref:Uncharacterized protein n=1 Tax=Zancudomyces culisetae TaxID=1213189 RepID=A0A1R1PUF6_ZANCU|nr:hypothetical protein AX774_g1892 [Zancudomyces culisetae]|eukprot:OMH84584.1 hypothetical protein AX774_g1892 [Zancudomyces culisetae]